MTEALEPLDPGLVEPTLNRRRKAAAKYHGRPCRACGGTLRYASNGACEACTREVSRTAYRIARQMQAERLAKTEGEQR